MANGTYEEKLPCGGDLRIWKTGWEIRYFFPGPDLRHKGTFVTVPAASVQPYIDAFARNFAEYEQLKTAIPGGADFSKPAACGMTIRLGSFRPGVCIESYHMPIATASLLKQVTDGYRYSLQRAPQVQEFLAKL